MKFKTVFIALLVVNVALAQVGIGTSSPNAKSILHLESTTAGFLPPRVTTNQRTTINNNVADASIKGLIVFDTDLNKLFIHSGTAWVETAGGADEPLRNQTTNTAATNTSTNIYYNGGSVALGGTTSNTNAQLDVQSTNKGVLVPRMTTNQRTAITSPAESLLVFDTDHNLYYHYSTANAAWLPLNVGIVKNVTATTYTLSVADNGKILDFTAATAITVTVPTGLPTGFQVSITQAGAGVITLAGSGGMVVNNRWASLKTSGQWAKVGLEVRATNSSVLSGDVQ